MILKVTDAELDQVLAIAKTQIPQLAQVQRIRLDPGTGITAWVDVKGVGEVQARIEIETDAEG